MVFWYLTIYLIFTVFALLLCLQLAVILKYYDTQINIIIITHKFGYILKNVSAVLASAFSYVSGWRYWSERYFVSFHKSMHNSRNLRAAFWNKNWLEYVTDCRADDNMYTAIARKVVGESARDHPETYCGSVWVHFSSKKFERMVREVMDVCLRVLKKSNKSRFDSYRIRNQEQCIDNLSRSSCIHLIALS